GVGQRRLALRGRRLRPGLGGRLLGRRLLGRRRRGRAFVAAHRPHADHQQADHARGKEHHVPPARRLGARVVGGGDLGRASPLAVGRLCGRLLGGLAARTLLGRLARRLRCRLFLGLLGIGRRGRGRLACVGLPIGFRFLLRGFAGGRLVWFAFVWFAFVRFAFVRFAFVRFAFVWFAFVRRLFVQLSFARLLLVRLLGWVGRVVAVVGERAIEL